MLISKCNLYFQLGAGLKKTIWNLLGLICSEKPLDTFDHSRCKTEGWAEQVNILRRWQNYKCWRCYTVWHLINKFLTRFQVVNQWETNSSQMPKQKKIEESRTSALRFCTFSFLFLELYNMLPEMVLKVFLFCSWKAEVCQRSPECSTPGLWKWRWGQERQTAFLQTCSKKSHTWRTGSSHNKSSSEHFLEQHQ